MSKGEAQIGGSCKFSEKMCASDSISEHLLRFNPQNLKIFEGSKGEKSMQLSSQMTGNQLLSARRP